MKYKSFVIYPILLLSVIGLIVSGEALAQVSIQAGAGAGLIMPSGDFGGTTLDFYSGTKYGMAAGFNFHAKGRMNFPTFGVTGEIGYSSMSNDGESEPGRGKVELSQKVFSIRVGPEYHLTVPNFPFKPYVGANIALNSFSEEVTFNGVASVPSGTYSVKSAVRFGLGVSGGAIIKISDLTSLDIGISYDFMNLVGRDWEDTNPSNDRRIDSYTSFNDDKDPVAVDGDDHIIGSARSIQAFRITASFLFGL